MDLNPSLTHEKLQRLERLLPMLTMIEDELIHVGISVDWGVAGPANGIAAVAMVHQRITQLVNDATVRG